MDTKSEENKGSANNGNIFRIIQGKKYLKYCNK